MDQGVQHAAAARSSWMEIFRGRLLVYTVLLNFGILFFGIDGFVVNTLMPTIVDDIGGLAYYAWATMLFVVGAIVGSAAYGPLRGRVGGRKALASGAAVFTVGALACSVAPHMGALLVARTVAGLGGGVIVAGSMAFTSALYEPRVRTRAIAFTSVTWIGCALLGPIIGGIFADIGWWRGAFWLYVPFAVVFLAGVWWKIPHTADQTTAASRALRFPFWRLACLAIGVLCVGFAGRVGSELERVALIAASIGFCWIAFARDAKASNRIFPSHPLSLSRPIGLGYWTMILIIGAYSAISIYLPLVLTVLHGVKPLYVGFVNALMSSSWSVSAALIAGLHGGAERKAMIAGPICLLLACAGFAAETHVGGGIGAIAALAILAGFGIGFVNVHMQAKCMAAAEPGEESITASSLSTVRSLGQAFGSAIGNTISNMAGLVGVATYGAVQAAATGVYLFNLIPLAFAIVVLLRFFAVTARPSTIASS